MPLKRRRPRPEMVLAEPPVVRSSEELISDLRDPSPEVRARAVMEVGEQRKALKALAEHMLTEPDRGVRLHICSVLLREQYAEAAGILAPLLGHGDAALRNEVRELLHGLAGGGEIADTLLQHADPEVRMFAIEIVASHFRGEAASRIVSMATQETDLNVITHAIEQLALIGTANELELLAELRATLGHEEYIAFFIDFAVQTIKARLSPGSEECD